MSSIFLPVLRHKDFFGWITSLHGEKKMFPISFDYFNIVYFLKNFGVFYLNRRKNDAFTPSTSRKRNAKGM